MRKSIVIHKTLFIDQFFVLNIYRKNNVYINEYRNVIDVIRRQHQFDSQFSTVSSKKIVLHKHFNFTQTM